MTDAPSVKAIVCTAHLLLAQNPKAELHPDQWLTYLCLVRDWCLAFRTRGVAIYWEPGIHQDEETRH
jgi:hypothetical protein